MFRYFQNLVDPYVDYAPNDRPPTRLWPFFVEYAQPFKKLFALAGSLAVAAAVIEIALIYYMGRIVDLLDTSEPGTFFATHGAELAFIALLILFVRPIVQALGTVVLNNAILPNFGALVRWRAHAQVLRQSVGWFESDFAGRIANRIMQTPGAAGDAVFQVFDALAYAIAYLIGATLLLSVADPRLALPILVWFSLYLWLVIWTVKRIAPASQASSDARSMVTGRVVDAYTNIHAVKMFAHHDLELSYAKEGIEHTRNTFGAEMRIFSIMDMCLVFLNGFLIVAVVGWGDFALEHRSIQCRHRRRRDCPDASAERHDRVDHVGGQHVFPVPWDCVGGDGDD